jgi:hypothetical protein
MGVEVRRPPGQVMASTAGPPSGTAITLTALSCDQ